MEMRDIENWRVEEILPYPNIKVPGSKDHHTLVLTRIEDTTKYVIDYCLAPYFTHKDLINEYGIFFSVHKEAAQQLIKVRWTDVVICMKVLMERKLKVMHPSTTDIDRLSNGCGMYVRQVNIPPLRYVEL